MVSSLLDSRLNAMQTVTLALCEVFRTNGRLKGGAGHCSGRPWPLCPVSNIRATFDSEPLSIPGNVVYQQRRMGRHVAPTSGAQGPVVGAAVACDAEMNGSSISIFISG